jgi:hypothetical protein
MAKAASFADEVLGSVANASPGNLSWFQRLPAEAQEQLEGLRRKFNPAVHQKRAFYRALKVAAERRGWKIAGERQVTLWLVGER